MSAFSNVNQMENSPNGALLEEQSTPKPTPEQDESLLLNTDLPIFLAEPQNAFVVKNRPATLQCRAAHALSLYFKCNGAKKVETVENWFVDPQTGVRIFEADANVTRDMVEEFFGKEKFKCECYAWSGRGSIKSQPATVEVAWPVYNDAPYNISASPLTESQVTNNLQSTSGTQHIVRTKNLENTHSPTSVIDFEGGSSDEYNPSDEEDDEINNALTTTTISTRQKARWRKS
ncbi:unnamed protein product [Diabrotica balteata]|uniref:Netrin receptor UNC5A-D-like N-terminal domain-containing protein n=1 Tax=Diabrotica balteata TaxID=107213 RepID=A0A9N9SWX9_DIABA|nr:unnamed protein product [Diabrotica balteata]